jgi:trans-2,3-dihydro-3-hydroxyanthranilate isomerase
MAPLRFRLVDVFAARPLGGNSLTVVVTDAPLDVGLMQALTIELRQFETIFLVSTDQPHRFAARVFTMEEELDFAGHPVIGAAAVLHESAGGDDDAAWTIQLNQQQVLVESRRLPLGYEVSMHQASPSFGSAISEDAETGFLGAFGLSGADRDIDLPMQMVTTGLPYLIVPVTAAGLERARIGVDDLEERLAKVGAKFAYLLDAREHEGRTWDNLGRVEDIATGSAAGPVAAYLVAQGLAKAAEPITLRQGRFTGRPSEMRLSVASGVEGVPTGVKLTGDVRMVASGLFDSLAGVETD